MAPPDDPRESKSSKDRDKPATPPSKSNETEAAVKRTRLSGDATTDAPPPPKKEDDQPNT